MICAQYKKRKKKKDKKRKKRKKKVYELDIAKVKNGILK